MRGRGSPAWTSRVSICMGILAVVALTSALACASTSSASSGSQMASNQGCPASQVPAVVAPSSELFARPDGNSRLVGNVDGGTRVCADTAPSGYNFRHVKLADGTEGFVND